jgi:hypothetical protein
MPVNEARRVGASAITSQSIHTRGAFDTDAMLMLGSVRRLVPARIGK